MRYYYLRLLSLIKRAVGGLTNLLLSFYNKINASIIDGMTKERTKIDAFKEKHVRKAQAELEYYAAHLLELQANLPKVEEDIAVKAHAKLVKLETKVK